MYVGQAVHVCDVADTHDRHMLRPCARTGVEPVIRLPTRQV